MLQWICLHGNCTYLYKCLNILACWIAWQWWVCIFFGQIITVETNTLTKTFAVFRSEPLVYCTTTWQFLKQYYKRTNKNNLIQGTAPSHSIHVRLCFNNVKVPNTSANNQTSFGRGNTRTYVRQHTHTCRTTHDADTRCTEVQADNRHILTMTNISHNNTRATKDIVRWTGVGGLLKHKGKQGNAASKQLTCWTANKEVYSLKYMEAMW